MNFSELDTSIILADMFKEKDDDILLGFAICHKDRKSFLSDVEDIVRKNIMVQPLMKFMRKI